jgi:hypothetical protein
VKKPIEGSNGFVSPKEKSKPASFGEYYKISLFSPSNLKKLVLDTFGFLFLKTSTALKLPNANITAKRNTVTKAPKVVVNFSSPFHVKVIPYPNRSSILKLFEHHFCVFSLSLIVYSLSLDLLLDFLDVIIFYRIFL